MDMLKVYKHPSLCIYVLMTAQRLLQKSFDNSVQNFILPVCLFPKA